MSCYMDFKRGLVEGAGDVAYLLPLVCHPHYVHHKQRMQLALEVSVIQTPTAPCQQNPVRTAPH